MLFNDAEELKNLIAAYFESIEGKFHITDVSIKSTKTDTTEPKKIWDQDPQPATISGLAHYLGFDSRKAFEAYENTQHFAHQLKRARLRVETEYEKKLHQQSSGGAIFALKSMGWTDKESAATDSELNKVFHVEITVSGPPPAANEKDVAL